MPLITLRTDWSRNAGINRSGASWPARSIVVAGALVEELSVDVGGRIIAGVGAKKMNSAGSIGVVRIQ